jgi:hypothetical protein
LHFVRRTPTLLSTEEFMGFYIPAAMLLAWGLYGALTLPRWHDSRYVRTPQRRFWGIWHFLDEREWTEEGQVVRQRYLRYLAVAVAVALVGIVIGKLVDSR